VSVAKLSLVVAPPTVHITQVCDCTRVVLATVHAKCITALVKLEPTRSPGRLVITNGIAVSVAELAKVVEAPADHTSRPQHCT
jgi:hypothetical protein